MSRARRHQLVTRLVGRGGMRNQEDLRQALEAHGISVTQATLSRDIRTLGLAKGPAGYVLPDQGLSTVPAGGDRATGNGTLASALARELGDATIAGTLVVLFTRPGHANALGVEIDRAAFAESVGTIAGDDTIFIATRSASDARKLADRLRRLAESDERAA